MVSNNLTKEDVLSRPETIDLPNSVIQYLQGYLGEPEGGFPEPFRTRALKGAPTVQGRPGASLEPLDFNAIHEHLTRTYGSWISIKDVMSYAMYPAVFEEYATHYNTYGDITNLSSDMVFKALEEGKEYRFEMKKGTTNYITPVAMGQVDPKTGMQDVFYEVNGAPKRIPVRNKVTAATAVSRPKANPSLKNEVSFTNTRVYFLIFLPFSHQFSSFPCLVQS